MPDQISLRLNNGDPLFEAYLTAGLHRRMAYDAAREDELVGKCLRILARRLEGQGYGQDTRAGHAA